MRNFKIQIEVSEKHVHRIWEHQVTVEHKLIAYNIAFAMRSKLFALGAIPPGAPTRITLIDPDNPPPEPALPF